MYHGTYRQFHYDELFQHRDLDIVSNAFCRRRDRRKHIFACNNAYQQRKNTHIFKIFLSMGKEHQYISHLVWTGNRGEGTSGYRSYDRTYTISVTNKPDFHGSADPMFRGDPAKHNPEDLLVMAISSCHLLWYLHLCADNGIVVTSYEDDAIGSMAEDAIRGGFFTGVTLNIKVTITDASKKEIAEKLHHDANKLCFIANSVNFPIKHSVTIGV